MEANKYNIMRRTRRVRSLNVVSKNKSDSMQAYYDQKVYFTILDLKMSLRNKNEDNIYVESEDSLDLNYLEDSIGTNSIKVSTENTISRIYKQK